MAFTPSRQGMFSLLPESKTPWSELVFSFGTQAVAVVILLWVSILHPDILKPPVRDYHAIELVPTPVPVNHTPQPVKLFPKPQIVEHFDAPTEALRLPTAQPKSKIKIEDTPAPEVNITAKKLDQIPAPATPAIPKQIVVTNTFSSGSSATPTVALTPSQVQTGGFGDPHGVAAKANPGKAVNIAQAGGFDMPTGSGSGNGTAGSHGTRGIVASSGFGGGTATGESTHTQAAVQKSGFGDADAPAPTVRSHPADQAQTKVIPAEILSKPVPAYTEEARNLKIEGEVLVQVVFEATGRIHVLKVVRGLGHGLDDEAIREAEQIHFKPALRDGQPSDSTAVLHFVFQLA